MLALGESHAQLEQIADVGEDQQRCSHVGAHIVSGKVRGWIAEHLLEAVGERRERVAEERRLVAHKA